MGTVLWVAEFLPLPGGARERRRQRPRGDRVGRGQGQGLEGVRHRADRRGHRRDTRTPPRQQRDHQPRLRSMSDRGAYAIIAMLVTVGLALSYGLARAGDPQSSWLWKPRRQSLLTTRSALDPSGVATANWPCLRGCFLPNELGPVIPRGVASLGRGPAGLAEP